MDFLYQYKQRYKHVLSEYSEKVVVIKNQRELDKMYNFVTFVHCNPLGRKVR